MRQFIVLLGTPIEGKLSKLGDSDKGITLRTPVPAHPTRTQSACCNCPVSRAWLWDDGASKEKCTEICSRDSENKNVSGCFLLLWEHLERGADQNPSIAIEPAIPLVWKYCIRLGLIIFREPRVTKATTFICQKRNFPPILVAIGTRQNLRSDA
jgi:hypothetical protein